MSDEKPTEKIESLGEYLFRHRKIKNLDLDDIAAETKIPAKTLRAIEADDYKMLPAEAFARGFYVLYAKHLGLEAQEVADRFSRERGKVTSTSYPTPLKQEKKVNNMAARPSLIAGSFTGFVLVVLIVVIAALCWYFSWNPATFLSQQLRSFQEPAPVEQLQNKDTAAPDTLSPNSELASAAKYILTVDFLNDTTATISVDDSFPEKEIFSKGATRSWYAKESIIMIIPESAALKILLNGAQQSLPEPKEGFITLELP